MADANAQPVAVNESPTQPPPAAKGAARVVPEWVNEEYFFDVLKDNVEGFKKIQSLETKLTGGGGENYASVMVRVSVKVEFEDGTTKDLGYMLKTFPQDEQSAMMSNMLGHFPKEIAMYKQYLPEFDKMYSDVGKTVRLGPKIYEFKKNPDSMYVLMDDLGQEGFKIANRLEGIDEEHTESVLKLLAQMHAASAVRRETVGHFDNQFVETVFSEKYRSIFEMIGNTFQKPFLECLEARPNHAKYAEKVRNIQSKMIDLIIEASDAQQYDFNVMCHGDLWINNILFRYNDSGEVQDTIFIDFQLSRYGPPVVDLFYFLLSSPKLEIKVTNFDKFVRYYHEHLVENLELLKYPKKIPTLRDLHIQLLKCGIMGFFAAASILGGSLINPTEDLSLEKFVNAGEEQVLFQKLMFDNPRYVKHLDVVLEWLDLRGLLDF